MPVARPNDKPGVGVFLMKPCLSESSSWRIVVFSPVLGFPEGAKRAECQPTVTASPLASDSTDWRLCGLRCSSSAGPCVEL